MSARAKFQSMMPNVSGIKFISGWRRSAHLKGTAYLSGTNFARCTAMGINRRKIATLGILSMLLAGFCRPIAGAEAANESHDVIRAAVEQHVFAQVDDWAGRTEVAVGRLDSRLRLARCDRALETYDSPNALSGGRGVVGVRCTGSSPWKLYVPVQISTFNRVVVSRRPLVRGKVLDAQDVTLSEKDTSGLHKAYYSAVDDVVGLSSKRAIDRGALLHSGLLKRAKLVKRGSRVEIVAQLGGLDVRMRGEALADGVRGDRIRVKNLSSGRVVTGTVTDSGLVHILN